MVVYDYGKLIAGHQVGLPRTNLRESVKHVSLVSAHNMIYKPCVPAKMSSSMEVKLYPRIKICMDMVFNLLQFVNDELDW